MYSLQFRIDPRLHHFISIITIPLTFKFSILSNYNHELHTKLQQIPKFITFNFNPIPIYNKYNNKSITSYNSPDPNLHYFLQEQVMPLIPSFHFCTSYKTIQALHCKLVTVHPNNSSKHIKASINKHMHTCQIIATNGSNIKAMHIKNQHKPIIYNSALLQT